MSSFLFLSSERAGARSLIRAEGSVKKLAIPIAGFMPGMVQLLPRCVYLRGAIDQRKKENLVRIDKFRHVKVAAICVKVGELEF